MTMRHAIERVMIYSAENGTDMNLSVIQMRDGIRKGTITNITEPELEAAHKFIKVHYDVIVAARKGDVEAEEKYTELLKAVK